MYSTPFGDLLSGISTKTELKETVGFIGMMGYQIQNITPANFNVYDENMVVLKNIPPWTSVQGSFNPTKTLTISCNYQMPIINAVGVSPSQYQFTLNTSTLALPESTTTLSMANAVANLTLDANGNPTINLAANQSVNATIANQSINVDVPNGVNLNNQSLSVTTTPGSQVSIANQIDANLTGASVTIDTNTSILNEKLGVNPTILAMRASGQLTIPANGNFSYFNALYDGLVGENITYDKLFLTLSSTKTDLSTISLMILSYYFHDPDMLIENVNLSLIPLSYSGGGNLNAIYEVVLPPLFPIGLVATQINNPTASAINDTFTVNVYGQYASQTVINESTNPVNTQNQLSTTNYNMGSFTFGSQSLASGQETPSQFTGSVEIGNAKKVSILTEQSNISGFVSASSNGCNFTMVAQGSYDGVTWFIVDGIVINLQVPNVNPYYEAIDSSYWASLAGAYEYLRIVIQIANYTNSTVTVSGTIQVNILVQE